MVTTTKNKYAGFASWFSRLWSNLGPSNVVPWGNVRRYKRVKGTDKDHQLRPDYTKTVNQVQDDFRWMLLEAAKKAPKRWLLDGTT